MKNMRYHLAHSRDIKKNGWNNRCPSCGQRKFSPYIDFHTGKPINENDDDNDNENRYPFRNNVIAFNGDLKVLNEVKNLAVGLGEGSFAMLRMTATGEASLCLVESEKTALIMSLVCPDRVWLATGGKANFKEQMLWSLLGHEVAVYPDADALTDWEQRIHRLNRELGHCLYIPTGYYNLMNHDRPRTEGWDLADVVLRLP